MIVFTMIVIESCGDIRIDIRSGEQEEMYLFTQNDYAYLSCTCIFDLYVSVPRRVMDS
jgi:hypothetical protein